MEFPAETSTNEAQTKASSLNSKFKMGIAEDIELRFQHSVYYLSRVFEPLFATHRDTGQIPISLLFGRPFLKLFIHHDIVRCSQYINIYRAQPIFNAT